MVRVSVPLTGAPVPFLRTTRWTGFDSEGFAMLFQSNPAGLPFFSTTFGRLLAGALCTLASEGVGETGAFFTRSATTTMLSLAPIPSWALPVGEPNRSVGVVTAATREPYVAPLKILVNRALTWLLFGIDSAEPFS